MFAKLLLVVALAGGLMPALAAADSGDDQYAVAAGHYARGRWKFSAEEFRVFLRDYPEHARAPNASFFLAEGLVQLGELDSAREQFRAFLNDYPDHRYAPQALFRVAEAAYLLGELEAARTGLTAFRDRYPNDALNGYVLPYLGEIALAEGDAQQAKGRFEEGLDQYPDGPLRDDCRFGLARAHERLANQVEAERIYLALSSEATGPLGDDAQLSLAALLYSAAEYESAGQAFAALERAFPQSEFVNRARLGRGWCQYQRGQYEEAAATFLQLAATDDLAIEAGYWLGLTKKAQRDWAGAAETLATIAFTPADELAPAIVFHAADSLLRAGEAAAAVERFDRVLAEWPQSQWADDGLLGRMQTALALADHATLDTLAGQFQADFAESPLRSEVERTMARSLAARERHEEAIGILEPLLAAAGASPPPYDQNLLAVAYHGAGRYEEARKLLAPLCESADGDLRNEARLAQAATLLALSRFEEAIAPLEAYLAASPEGTAAAKARGQLAVAYARSGRTADARRMYEELLQRHPGDELVGPTTQNLAEAALAAGEHAWAAELFDALSDDGQPEGYAAKGLSGLGWSQYRAGQLAEAAGTFDRLLRQFPQDPLAAEAALARGRILERLEQPAAALAMYHLVIEEYSASPGLAGAMLAAARLHDRLEQKPEAAKLYQRLVEEHPLLGERDAALYEWAWVSREQGQAEQADALFERLRQEYPESPFWADATYRLAERAVAAKGYDRADELLAVLMATSPAAEVLPHALFLQGQTAVGRQRWQDVPGPMRRLVTGFPEHKLRPRAEYWIGEAQYRMGEHTEAADTFSRLAERIEGERAAWMAIVPLRRAQLLALERKWAEARKMAEGIAADFPQFEKQYEVEFVLGRCLASQAEFDHARQAYRQVINSPAGRGTQTAAQAQWMIGESYFHQKDYETALKEFLRVEILYDYPLWQAAALLEAGKCHEQLDEWRAAAELYQRIVNEFTQTELRDEAARRLRAAQERVARRP